MKEAQGNASLDPLSVVDHLTVGVPTYAGWLPDDEVSVTWAGVSPYTTPPEALGSSREVALPVSLVAYDLGRDVQVTYTVTRNGLPLDGSMPLMLQVLPMSESALGDSRPQILQATNAANGSGVLNLNVVTAGATIRILNWPHIAVGQTLWLRLHGKNADGSDRSLTIWHPPGSKVSQDWFTQGYYDVAVPYSYLSGLMWGNTLSVELKVGFDQSLDEDEATVFPIRTYVIDNWKDLITTFNDGTMGDWTPGPAVTQGKVSGGTFINETSSVTGNAGVVLRQLFLLSAGRTYQFSFKIRSYISTGRFAPNFSVKGPVLGEIIPAWDVPMAGNVWYERVGNFSVPSSGSYEIDLVSNQDSGSGNDYQLDDIVVTLAADNWKDSITAFSDGTIGNWLPGPAFTQGAVVVGGFFRNPTTAASGHAGVVMRQSFLLSAGKIYRFSFRARSYLVGTVGLKPNFSINSPELGEIIPAQEIPLDGKWYVREGYFSVPFNSSYEIDLVSHQDRGGGGGADGGNDYDIDYMAVTLAAG